MRVRSGLAAVLLLAATSLVAPPASAVIVERVVAVVGDKPILQSELRERSLPFLAQIESKVPEGPQRSAAVSQLDRDLLQKMVEEELIAQAAERSHLTVTTEELDNAISNMAAQQGYTIEQLFKAARAQANFNEQYYRDEIRRQVLEGKMLQLRVKGRVHITEEDVRQKYESILKEERARLDFHPAWIVIHVFPGSSPEATEERKQLAEQIARRAQRGEDFAALVKAYSDDSARKENGGDLGWKSTAPPANPQPGEPPRKFPVIAKELETPLLTLEPGQVTNVVHIGDDFIVLKLLARAPSTIPLYEKAKPLVLQLKQSDILMAEKKKWLEELKQRTPVVIRG